MTPAARQALIGLGANVGDRRGTLRRALERLEAGGDIHVLAVSRLFETEPVGLLDQPRFLNQVAGVSSRLAPESLLARLQEVETEFGRVRTVRWGPRTLDLDLLAFEGAERTGERLELPHPRMLERAFVVVPLREVLVRPEFQRPAWDELRLRAQARLPDEAGVWPFA